MNQIFAMLLASVLITAVPAAAASSPPELLKNPRFNGQGPSHGGRGKRLGGQLGMGRRYSRLFPSHYRSA
jgi:hypothetical protein